MTVKTKRRLLNTKLLIRCMSLVVMAVVVSSFSIAVALCFIYYSSTVEKLGTLRAAEGGLRMWGIVSGKAIITQALLLILISMLFGIYFVIFLTRVFGPLERLKKAMIDLKENGRIEKIEIRKQDYLTDLVDVFNNLADCIEKEYVKKNV